MDYVPMIIRKVLGITYNRLTLSMIVDLQSYCCIFLNNITISKSFLSATSFELKIIKNFIDLFYNNAQGRRKKQRKSN